jgi:hypothetical protein
MPKSSDKNGFVLTSKPLLTSLCALWVINAHNKKMKKPKYEIKEQEKVNAYCEGYKEGINKAIYFMVNEIYWGNVGGKEKKCVECKTSLIKEIGKMVKYTK